MQGALLKLGLWLIQKLGGALLIVLVALAGYGLWMYLQEEGAFESSRVEKLERAIAERDRLHAAQAAIEQRIAGFRAEIEQQRVNARRAEKVISTLRELESWWERWFGNTQQQAANVEQVKRMEELKGSATARMGELQRLVTQTIWEQDSLAQALRHANDEVMNLEASRSRTRHFVFLAWEKVRWWRR
jgi:hypothetical protein